MQPTLFSYIFKYSRKEQILLLILTISSFPFLYASLEVPKIIVNEAIGSTDFPKTVFGFDLMQIQYLFMLCGLFLLLVFVRFIFRYYINVYKGQLGERMLRRLRYQLFSRVLRFPLPRFRKTSQGEIIAMITAEVEPVGGFVGEAFATPAFEGGTMLTILAFMFAQDWKLGLAAMALSPVQAYIIPKLQRQVNVLAKQRVQTVRKLSERLGEVVSGIENVHSNDTAEYEKADISRWLGTIYEIRYKIYKKKFFIKFLNNFIGQLTPFFFFSIGGYLVITGDLTFGALVAVLAAYKDLSSPWKELLKWYQIKEDTRIKYDQLVEQFDPPGILDESLQTPADGVVPRLSGTVVANGVTLEEEDGIRVVDRASFSFDLSERVAIVGQEGSGASSLAKLIARLLIPTSGSIRIGDIDLATISQTVTGRRIAYVGQSGHLFQGSIGDNLYYGLKHQPIPIDMPKESPAQSSTRKRRIQEAQQSGSTVSQPDGLWIDLRDADARDLEDLSDRAVTVLSLVGMDDDLFGFGLQGRIDPASHEGLSQQILDARRELRDRLEDAAYTGLVEPFDRDKYNNNMTLAENLLFGTPIGPVFDLEHIAENPYMLSVLRRFELEEVLVSDGLQVAKIMLELFQGAQPGDELFERFSFISVDALPTYQGVLRRANPQRLDRLSREDRKLLLSLPFKLIPARHRLGLITGETTPRLLAARHAFAQDLPADLQHAVAFFEPDQYNPAASVQDNVLFGRLVYGRLQAQRLVGGLIEDVITRIGLRRAIVAIGFDHQVGIGGSRLSAAQRQKMLLARALLKQPDLLVLDHATATLDPASQTAIMRAVVAERGAVVWVLNSEVDASAFDRVLVMDHGRVVRDGKPDEEDHDNPPDGAAVAQVSVTAS